MSDIAVITICHQEGRFMHPSVMSTAMAIEEAKKSGLTTEWIIISDAGDHSTLTYLKHHKPADARLIEVDFGDSGLARNHGVQVASSQFVSFIHAGDIWSPNWLVAAHAFAGSLLRRDVVLHSGVNLFFGQDSCWVTALDSESPEFSKSILFADNCWTASSFASREIYLRLPFPPSDAVKDFGCADWQWNCETLGAGIAHKLVPDTFHCCPQESMSQFCPRDSETGLVVMKASKLFRLAYQND